MFKPLIVALQLLTRIPIPVEIEATEQQFGRSILFYPVVGLLIGLILYGLANILPENTLILNAAIITVL
ncbi:MAG: adenosylcobinamide-GDP ribazoletransferase, partial [Gammaproteobacteria bacterium]|nr:adenosylcobinamide-GDP ribazoletransferase [Gammaproteobacteria bacterium]